MYKRTTTAMAAARDNMGRQAAIVLLAAAAIALLAAPAAAQNTTAGGVITGQSALSIAAFPLDSTYKLHGHAVEVYCGPNVIRDRVALDKAGYTVDKQTFGPVGSALRFTNFTAHPSLTPGLDNYTCIDYTVFSYATNPQGPAATFHSADSLFLVISQTEKLYAQLGFDVRIFILHTYKVPFNGSTLPTNITAADTTDMLSQVQVSGPTLLPFTYDKQMLLVDAILTSSRLAGVPIATANVSDWRAAAAARNGTRRLLQTPVDSFAVDLWTELIPSSNLTAAQMWPVIAPGIKSFTKAAGYAMTLKFRNATVSTRLKGQPLAAISTEPRSAPGSITVQGQEAGSSSGGGLSGGAIAGIVAGCIAGILLLAALVVFGIRRLRRRRQREHEDRKLGGGKPKAVLAHKMSGSDGSASSGSETASSADSIAISPADVEICHHPDGRAWVLGAGHFGKVYRGLWRGHHDVAIKQLTCYADEMLLSALRKEINILKRVSFNRNVVQFYGFCLDESAPMLVMELMEGGDLRKALWQNKEEYAWDRRGGQVALDIARGLHFLHSSGVIHRDIKSSNVLLTREGVAKIADVGLAITADYFSAGSATGTFSYAAPELLMGGKCSPKVDSYSFGVVLWEIITKQAPVRGHLREVRDDEAPPGVQKLLEDCINVDVSQRPDAAEILQRLQASTPGLAATSSRSLGSAASVPQPLLAADAVPSDLLQQPLCTDGSSGMAGSEFHTPADSTAHDPFAAQRGS